MDFYSFNWRDMGIFYGVARAPELPGAERMCYQRGYFGEERTNTDLLYFYVGGARYHKGTITNVNYAYSLGFYVKGDAHTPLTIPESLQGGGQECIPEGAMTLTFNRIISGHSLGYTLTRQRYYQNDDLECALLSEEVLNYGSSKLLSAASNRFPWDQNIRAVLLHGYDRDGAEVSGAVVYKGPAGLFLYAPGAGYMDLPVEERAHFQKAYAQTGQYETTIETEEEV